MNGIVLDADFDLKIKVRKDSQGKIVGGLIIDNIDYQRCHLITIAQKGEFKFTPTLGFGIDSYLKDTLITNNQKFKTELQKELKTDGIDAEVLINQDNKNFTINQK